MKLPIHTLAWGILWVCACLVGCNSQPLSIIPEFNLCNSRPFEEYAQKLYADTAIWAGDSATIHWYQPRIKQIIKQVENNCTGKIQVYPFKAIDKVVFYNNPLGINGKELDQKQVIELLSIINDPLNFDWGETTFEVHKIIVFESDGQEIARLKIMANNHVLASPENIMMKFGSLQKQGTVKLQLFLDSI